MKSLARLLLIGALVQLGACATNIEDMRLERLTPVTATNAPPPRYPGDDFGQFGGIIAEFSSARDMRRQTAWSETNLYPVVARCAGRTHLDDHQRHEGQIGSGDFFDDFGVLADAGRYPEVDAGRMAPTEGERRNGRFFFRMQIHMTTYARRRPSAIMDPTSIFIYHDLRRDQDDLCIYARGGHFLGFIWLSNTVVIPYAAIREALDSAPAP